MSKDLFDDIKDVIDNNYASVAVDGTYADTIEFVDTGSYALNALYSGSIYGGIQGNKVSALAGEEATGKTFFMLGIIKNFLDTDLDARCVLFESEGAISKELLESRGIDVERVLIIPVETIQQFRTQALRVVNNYLERDEEKRPPLIMGLDSLGMLSTTKELTDSESGSETKDMTRAQLVKSAFRTLTLKLSKAGIPLLVTNHLYAKVGSFIPGKEMSGGSGVKYASSDIKFLSKSQFKDGKEVTGVCIKVKNIKSRNTREKKQVEVRLMFESGLDRYYGLLGLAVEAGIVTKLSKQYQFPDGTKAFETKINKNPEKYFTQDILDQIDEYAQTAFEYGAPEEDDIVEEILNE
jgi:RecA/RadA recombinase